MDPDGWALIQIPLNFDFEKTFEDPSINTPRLRKKYYGQKDHLRYYGLDFKNRLEEGGFDVKAVNYSDFLDSDIVESYSLLEQDIIYFCRK